MPATLDVLLFALVVAGCCYLIVAHVLERRDERFDHDFREWLKGPW